MSIESLRESHATLSRAIDRDLAAIVRGRKGREISAALDKSHNYIASIRPRKGDTAWGGSVETKIKILEKLNAIFGEGKK